LFYSPKGNCVCFYKANAEQRFYRSWHKDEGSKYTTAVLQTLTLGGRTNQQWQVTGNRSKEMSADHWHCEYSAKSIAVAGRSRTNQPAVTSDGQQEQRNECRPLAL